MMNLPSYVSLSRKKNKKLIPENTPPSIAVGIIYFVCQKCNLNITKRAFIV